MASYCSRQPAGGAASSDAIDGVPAIVWSSDTRDRNTLSICCADPIAVRALAVAAAALTAFFA